MAATIAICRPSQSWLRAARAAAAQRHAPQQAPRHGGQPWRQPTPQQLPPLCSPALSRPSQCSCGVSSCGGPRRRRLADRSPRRRSTPPPPRRPCPLWTKTAAPARPTAQRGGMQQRQLRRHTRAQLQRHTRAQPQLPVCTAKRLQGRRRSTAPHCAASRGRPLGAASRWVGGQVGLHRPACKRAGSGLCT